MSPKDTTSAQIVAYEVALLTSVASCSSFVKAQATKLAEEHQLPEDEVRAELATAVKDTVCTLGYGRGNAVFWRTRARIYDNRDIETPEADSDPDRPITAPGAEVIRSLTEVAAWACALARMHHGTPCMGLGKNQTRAIQTVRNMIYRRGDGTGTMTIHYTTKRMVFAHQTPEARYMTLRVDLVRIGSEGDIESEAPRRIPGLK